MELMENKYYYKFRPRFEYNNDNITIFNLGIEYLEIGFNYLGYIVMNKIYRNSYSKFKLDIKYTINKLIKEFNRMMEFDDSCPHTRDFSHVRFRINKLGSVRL